MDRVGTPRKVGSQRLCNLLPKTFALFITKMLLPYLWPGQKFDTLFMTSLFQAFSYSQGAAQKTAREKIKQARREEA